MALAFVGAWTALQSNNFATSATNTGRTTTTGNFIVVGLTLSASANFSSLTDNKGNVYTLAAPASGWQVAGGGDSIRIYYCANASGGASHAITLTCTGAGNYTCLCAAEYSTTSPPASLDQRAGSGAAGTGASLNSGNTPTTTSANELLTGHGTQDGATNGTWTAGASYAIRSSNGNAGTGSTGCLEDRIVSAAGIYNATATTSGMTPGGWDMLIATFKEAGAVAPGASPAIMLSHL